ncbi:hypothetical protein G134_657 [Lactobacillus delbrueckii subsp. lactis CRL581]|nr:hypothetical protein G134_657 [Lactobacillus delbrueckii subsp. lactis CRL581]
MTAFLSVRKGPSGSSAGSDQAYCQGSVTIDWAFFFCPGL